jgi:antitoxin (DNA-binding transcriptional repressor) of toxin-antitoxin stability system
VLDAVETRGESFLVVRRGRAVARIAPASAGHGRAVKELLRSAPSDSDWLDDLRRIRSSVQAEDRRWSG